MNIKYITLNENKILPANHKYTAVIFLILGAISIGFAPIFVRLSSIGPFATGFWRVALAIPLFYLVMFVNWNNRIESNSRIDLLWAIFSGVIFGTDLAIWHLSIEYTTVANASTLCNLAPMLLVISGWVFYKKNQIKL